MAQQNTQHTEEDLSGSLFPPHEHKALSAFKDRRILHRNLRTTGDELIPLLRPESETNILVVVGATGVGKSTFVKHLLPRLLPAGFQESSHGMSQVPMVRVQAYADGNTKKSFAHIYRALLKELAEPGLDKKAAAEVKDGRLVFCPPSRSTVSALRSYVESALRYRRTRIGVIDEAAHLRQLQASAEVMQTFKSLSNSTDMKWILVGSFDLYEFLVQSGQVARRSQLVLLDRYHSERKEDCAEFKRVVVDIQSRWPCEQVPQLVDVTEQLMKATFGCVGLLVTLAIDAVSLQMRNNGKWKPEFLARAVKTDALLRTIEKEIVQGESAVRAAIVNQSSWAFEAFKDVGAVAKRESEF